MWLNYLYNQKMICNKIAIVYTIIAILNAKKLTKPFFTILFRRFTSIIFKTFTKIIYC